MSVKTGIGQASHRFLSTDSSKPCVIGGLIFDDAPGFNADSDGDIVLHSLCNAIATLTGEPIDEMADDLCLKDGITDSEVYLKHALKTLGRQAVAHVSITIEAKKPSLKERIPEMRENIARIMGLSLSQVGITAVTGEGLTDFGCGDGAQAFSIITTTENQP